MSTFFAGAVPTYRAGWDGTGAMLSALCIVHCLLLPLAVAAIPTLLWLEDEIVHQLLVFSLLIPAIVALAAGYRHHRRLLLIGIAGLGLALMMVAAYSEPPKSIEIALTLSAGAALITVHSMNFWWCRRCPTCRGHATASSV